MYTLCIRSKAFTCFVLITALSFSVHTLASAEPTQHHLPGHLPDTFRFRERSQHIWERSVDDAAETHDSVDHVDEQLLDVKYLPHPRIGISEPSPELNDTTTSSQPLTNHNHTSSSKPDNTSRPETNATTSSSQAPASHNHTSASQSDNTSRLEHNATTSDSQPSVNHNHTSFQSNSSKRPLSLENDDKHPNSTSPLYGAPYPGRYGHSILVLPALHSHRSPDGDKPSHEVSPNTTSKTHSLAGSSSLHVTKPERRAKAHHGDSRVEVIIVGGQVGLDGTYVTNDVFLLQATMPYIPPPIQSTINNSSDQDSNNTASKQDHSHDHNTANPKRIDKWSTLLPPRAWGASAVSKVYQPDSDDPQMLGWLIGGVVEHCSTDAPIYTAGLGNMNQARGNVSWSGWTPVTVEPWLNQSIAVGNGARVPQIPPRRRQISAITLSTPTRARGRNDSKSLSSTHSQEAVYVYAGIAEKYTCSMDSLAYLGMDIYSPSLNKPSDPKDISHDTTGADSAPANPMATYKTAMVPAVLEPPVTDYAMIVVDETSIVIVGGQRGNGSWATLDQALVYNTTNASWTKKNIDGPTPQARLAHSLTELWRDTFLLFGGLAPSASNADNTTHSMETLASAFILDTSDASSWRWSTVIGTNETKDIEAPARAYHSAVYVGGGEVVMIYGMDEDGQLVEAADAFMSVRVTASTVSDSDATNTFQAIWGKMGQLPAPKPVVQPAPATVASSSSTVKAIKVTTTSKSLHHIVLSDHHTKSASPKETTTVYQTVSASQKIVNSQSVQHPLTSDVAVKLNHPSATPSVLADPVPSSDENQSSTSSGSKKVVAGVMTGLFASAALVGGLVLFARRRAVNSMTTSAQDGHRAAPATSLYTRPAGRNIMSRLSSQHLGAASPISESGTPKPGWNSASSRDKPPKSNGDGLTMTPRMMSELGVAPGIRVPSRSHMQRAQMSRRPPPERLDDGDLGTPHAEVYEHNNPFQDTDGGVRLALPGSVSPVATSSLGRDHEVRAPSLQPVDSHHSGASVESYPYLMPLSQRAELDPVNAEFSPTSAYSPGVSSPPPNVANTVPLSISSKKLSLYTATRGNVRIAPMRHPTEPTIRRDRPEVVTAATWLNKIKPRLDAWLPNGTVRNTPTATQRLPSGPSMMSQSAEAKRDLVARRVVSMPASRFVDPDEPDVITRQALPESLQPRRGNRELRIVNTSPQL